NAITPVLPTEELEYSLSMVYEHPSTILETESDKVIKSSVKNLIAIPKIDSKDILQIQDVILLEKLSSINRLVADIEFLNDNPTPDRVLKSSSSFPIFEKSDNPLPYLDNSLPEFETFSDHTEETRSGSTTANANNSPPEYDSFYFEMEPNQGRLTIVVIRGYPFLEELLSNDSISLPNNESSYFDHHDDPSFPRPPLEPLDVEIFFEPDSGVLTTNVVKGISEHYVIMPNILPTFPTFNPLCLLYDTLLLFSSENENKVFKPGILSYLLVSHQDKTTSDFSENSMMIYGEDIPFLDVLDLHTILMDK
nr:hypothetical protein [Tanacetum cinerariifolium]